jgi:hypothetical protein
MEWLLSLIRPPQIASTTTSNDNKGNIVQTTIKTIAADAAIPVIR